MMWKSMNNIFSMLMLLWPATIFNPVNDFLENHASCWVIVTTWDSKCFMRITPLITYLFIIIIIILNSCRLSSVCLKVEARLKLLRWGNFKQNGCYHSTANTGMLNWLWQSGCATISEYFQWKQRSKNQLWNGG